MTVRSLSKYRVTYCLLKSNNQSKSSTGRQADLLNQPFDISISTQGIRLHLQRDNSRVTAMSLFCRSSNATDYIHLYFLIKLRDKAATCNSSLPNTAEDKTVKQKEKKYWRRLDPLLPVRCCGDPLLSAERMWILWRPPFAYNTQRLSDKWSACGDLQESTSRSPHEAVL